MNLDRFGFKAQRCGDRVWMTAELRDGYYPDYGVLWSDEKLCWTTVKIDLETLCQCTGLKDSDGKLIYENDIVKIRHCGAEGWFCQRGVVRYDNLHWYIAEDVNDWNDWWESWSLYDIAGGKLLGKLYDVYIIGNKFDKEGMTDEP